ncbi:unnamed protein product [Rotaria sp. Silwood1]|nr:unnamed protein product [Rotaria sp. Silwood1]CAF1623011.1 unnamed protein product [Rotaria sp. Silwood1]CAF3785903.1 unnamed protein product [Rotaria sp. Silwood1]CAF3790681.1 unnamed protein product [Rotaria sp. Silwood1]CAF4752016.1 unnamed protein product [Rotaria sp. Silwood1]
MTALLSPFNGKTIVLELGREIGFKAKQELIKYLREQQARIAYMLTANSIAGGEQQQDKNVLIQYALSDDPYEQQQLFASYYYHVATMPHVTRIREILSGKLGSKLLLRVST